MGDFGVNSGLENVVSNEPVAEKSAPKPVEVWGKARAMLQEEVDGGKLSLEEEIDKRAKIVEFDKKIAEHEAGKDAIYTSITGTNQGPEKKRSLRELNDQMAAIEKELEIIGVAPSIPSQITRKGELEVELMKVRTEISDLVKPSNELDLEGGFRKSPPGSDFGDAQRRMLEDEALEQERLRREMTAEGRNLTQKEKDALFAKAKDALKDDKGIDWDGTMVDPHRKSFE